MVDKNIERIGRITAENVALDPGSTDLSQYLKSQLQQTNFNVRVRRKSYGCSLETCIVVSTVKESFDFFWPKNKIMWPHCSFSKSIEISCL